MGRALAVGCVGEQKCIQGFLVGRLQEGDSLNDMGTAGRIILKGILKKQDGGRGVKLSGSVDRLVAGSCELGNEPSSSIKRGDYLG